MGKAWHDSSAEARSVFSRADALLGDRLGAPLSELCFSGPADRLNQTDVSQPAIFTASFACWTALLAQWGLSNADAPILATAGLSLGEYTALTLAGAMTFEDGLELVTLRGRAMQDAAAQSKGGMVAIIGGDEAQADAVCEQARGGEILVCANFNAPGQIVISGSLAACERAVGIAAAMGLKATNLPVAGAFHSPLMQPAADRLAQALSQTPIQPARVPVISNVTATDHQPTPNSIRQRLAEQLTSPVRWSESCTELARRHGSDTTVQWHELSPGKTLMGLMRRIDRTIKVTPNDAPALPTPTLPLTLPSAPR